jgi:hypothetical protein
MEESEVVYKSINDLGAAAYILMHHYKLLGRSGRSIYFEINKEDVEEFNKLQVEYLQSEFHRFDSCLMSLKKINEYMPKNG